MSRNKIKDAEKFETYDYGWLMVHDEDMIMYVWEVKFSFKMFSFIGHGYDFGGFHLTSYLFIHDMYHFKNQYQSNNLGQIKTRNNSKYQLLYILRYSRSFNCNFLITILLLMIKFEILLRCS